ncbi:LINE-1 retrotransposable element ORF1 protein [Dissostichus eleginoides]|uniref:LINE-1 retrotransposable element ORF1 protein n=1 Tax=Dissostichus eleginoides TaxID=100907 RepID=A0AAD9CPK7_DISEL|nr:LINE-1 retrotransposable element ORF1 protein [Dissostichus eleginoides]
MLHQANRITEAEERIGKTEDDLNSMHSAIKKLQDKCATLEMKVEDQENRGRRNNLRLIGLPEKAEGQDVCAFLEQWLPRALGTDTFSTLPVIERADRIGRLIAGQDPKPRAVIMRFLNYRAKENAMRAARRQGTVRFENHNVRLYPDHSAETHRQQKLFEAVKKQLQSMGLCYGMFYPAILVVTHNGHRHSFNTVPDAEKFVQKLQKDARPTPVPN